MAEEDQPNQGNDGAPPTNQPSEQPIEQPSGQPSNNRIVTSNRPPRPRNPNTPNPATPMTPAVGPSAEQGMSPPEDVVNATPRPLTPGPLRRELGVTPIRLTPRSTTDSPAPSGQTPGTPQDVTQETEMVLWGTTINIEDAEKRLTDFIRGFKLQNTDQDQDMEDQTKSHYLDLLEHLMETGGSIINIDMSHLHTFDSGMYRKMVAYPNELVTVFDAVVLKVYSQEYPEEAAAIEERRRKPLQVRIYNLLSEHVQSMRELNPKDISTMVAVRGMVIRASNIIPDIQRAMYRCNKCRFMTSVSISFGRIEEPRKCNSCNTRDSYTLIHSRSTFSDKQMVRLQEAPEAIPKGETPATFTLIMYDSLVDTVKPGDRVEITGILRATPVRVNPKLRVVRSVFRTYIDCVHVRTLNNNQSRKGMADDSLEKDATGQRRNEMEGVVADADTFTEEQKAARKQFFEELACHPKLYERLSTSLAPSIFGMEDEKKGVLLQLFGGASKSGLGQANEETIGDGSARFRSAINVLLVGDPGTSKSQLLHSAHRLAPRGVYTSGRGSSAVGLTAYVTKDPDSDDYVLESGALVLSDRGLCCIDEFDKMSDFARSVLHEAMEQQTVSIAKAGIIATLNARTSVLAAANPVNSRYDTSKSVVDNIDLPPTLLSRFDLIYLVLDAPNAESDRKLAQHIVSLFFKNYDEVEKKEDNANEQEEDEIMPNVDEDLVPDAPQYGSGGLLGAKTLTEYIAYSKEKVDPRLTDSAADALIQGYLDMRAGGRGSGNITATPRQLESLIRLAEAHARMQLKEDVEEEDVNEAIRLVKSALHMAAYDPNTGKIDMNLFTAGKSRIADNKIESIGSAIISKLEERGEAGDIAVSRLLAMVRATSDADITPGDMRDALRRLEELEKITMRSGGSSVQLI